MHKIWLLVKLDLSTVKPYLTLKNLLIVLVICAFLTYGTDSYFMVIGMLMMYGIIYASTPFLASEKNGLDILYATLPVTRSHIVTGRYLFSLSINVIMGVAAFVMALLIAVVFGMEYSIMEILITIMICFVLYSIIQALQLPIYFKLGYEKAKFLAYLPLLGFPAAAIAAGSLIGRQWGQERWLPVLKETAAWMTSHIVLLGALSVLIWLLVMSFSRQISYRFYQRKEF